MPRYFFNVKDHHLIVDNTGVELSGMDEVHAQVRELVALAERIIPNASFSLVVTDEDKTVVLEWHISARQKRTSEPSRS
jgi:hypothetical protein